MISVFLFAIISSCDDEPCEASFLATTLGGEFDAFYYDHNGRLATTFFHSTDDFRSDFKYNAKGQLSEVTQTSLLNGVKTSQTYIWYNPAGQVLGAQVYDERGNRVTDSTSVTYDPSGRIYRCENIADVDSKPYVRSYFEMSYPQEDQIIVERFILDLEDPDGDGNPFGSSHTSVYFLDNKKRPLPDVCYDFLLANGAVILPHNPIVTRFTSFSNVITTYTTYTYDSWQRPLTAKSKTGLTKTYTYACNAPQE